MGGDWCSSEICGLGTCIHWPTSSNMRRDTTGEIFLALTASPIRLGSRCSTRCPKVFEPSASQAMPCLAGFRVRGNKHRAILNHNLLVAMLLNWGGGVGGGGGSPPVSRDPEMPFPKYYGRPVGFPALDSGYKATANPGRPWATQAQCHLAMHMHTCIHNNVNS